MRQDAPMDSWRDSRLTTECIGFIALALLPKILDCFPDFPFEMLPSMSTCCGVGKVRPKPALLIHWIEFGYTVLVPLEQCTKGITATCSNNRPAVVSTNLLGGEVRTARRAGATLIVATGAPSLLHQVREYGTQVGPFAMVQIPMDRLGLVTPPIAGGKSRARDVAHLVFVM